MDHCIGRGQLGTKPDRRLPLYIYIFDIHVKKHTTPHSASVPATQVEANVLWRFNGQCRKRGSTACIDVAEAQDRHEQQKGRQRIGANLCQAVLAQEEERPRKRMQLLEQDCRRPSMQRGKERVKHVLVVPCHDHRDVQLFDAVFGVGADPAPIGILHPQQLVEIRAQGKVAQLQVELVRPVWCAKAKP